MITATMAGLLSSMSVDGRLSRLEIATKHKFFRLSPRPLITGVFRVYTFLESPEKSAGMGRTTGVRFPEFETFHGFLPRQSGYALARSSRGSRPCSTD